MTITNKLIKHLALVSLIILMSGCEKQQSDSTTTNANAPAVEKSAIADAVADKDMGLSKTSVFDTPDPETFSYSDKFPGSSSVFPRAYPDAPPQIPHNIDSFKPITTDNNACMGCHNNPSMRGKEIPEGMPTPMPESHYIDLRHKPDTVREQIVEARYVCTQCHVPQANVEVLVENSFASQK